MSKANDALRAQKIYNPHMLLAAAREQGLTDVYIDYRAYEGGRASRTAAWQVLRPGHQTDPETHWMNNGWKTFHVHSGDKAEVRQEAITWASEMYGIPADSWVPCPGFRGALVPKPVAVFAKKLIKEAPTA